jgi:ABC-2 type transport system permease protein
MSALVAAAPGVYMREARAEVIKSARMPEFAIPTIVLPPAFYALFALGMGRGDVEMATHTLATFGVFAVMGPSLFGFGANVASERQTGQLELKRLSPMPAGAHIAAKLIATMIFSAIAIGLVYGLAILAGVSLSLQKWAMLAVLHVLAVIPFALIGLGIGYRMGQKGAIAIVNVLFLGMAVMGGLWMPTTVLPEVIQTAAWSMPSYHLGEMALMIVGRSDSSNLWLHVGPLALITLGSAIFAWTGQQRHAA